MKRNLWLKILSLIAVLCICFSFAACDLYGGDVDEKKTQDEVNELLPEDEDGDDDKNSGGTQGNDDGDKNLGGNQGDYSDKNVHGEVNELLTVDELVDFHLNGAKYPDNFIFEELNDYGRVIESSSSREDALSTATEHFNSGWGTTVECRLDVETDLFYGLYVKWDYRSGGVGEPTSYYDEYVVSFKKDVYDAENKQFFTKDKDEIKSILDYIYYSRTYQIFGSKVYSSNITLEGDKYTYTAYVLEFVGGDWGIQDALYFIRTEVRIDLTTGKMEYNKEKVGTVYIDGPFTHIHGVD